MGGGVSKPAVLPPPPTPAIEGRPPCEAARKGSTGAKRKGSANQPKKEATDINGRIVQTLRDLCLKRQSANAKTMNFERIALKFGIAYEAFETIHCIYDQFASEQKGGLDYDGLKAALNRLGAHMDEKDMREIFYESDMVRDNSLSKNEFIVSLAISYLLGLISNFDHISRSLGHVHDEVTVNMNSEISQTSRDASTDDRSNAWSVNGEIQTPREPESARDTSYHFTEGSPELIAKALELMVNAYMLFDDDASGTIQVNEVRNIMRKHNSSTAKLQRKASGMNSKAIQVERIKELDVDQDGTITFQEFVLTFQKWVSSDDDEYI